jgi:tape measure domain-containing protein
MAEKELVVKLLGDISDLKAKLNEMNAVISKSTKSSADSFKIMGMSLDSIAKTLAGGFIAKQIFNIGKSAIATAGQFEQFNVAFSTMLGSASKAKVLLNDIKNFAATTPFELPEVVSGAKQLLAYGIAAKDIIPTMTTLGNISAGLGVPLSRLNLVYGQVRTSNRLLGNDLRQFQEAGVPIIEALSKTMGVSENAVKGMASAGKIGFKEVQKALESLGGAGGKFGGLMIAQSKTIGGVFSNISDNITQVMLELGNAMLPVVKFIAINLLDALNKIRVWFQDNQASIQNFFLNLYTAFSILSKVAIDLGQDIWNWVIRPLIDFIRNPIVATILAIVAAYYAWVGVTMLLAAANAALATVNPFTWIVVGIAAAVVAFNLITKKWDWVLGVIGKGLNILYKIFKTVIDLIVALFTGRFLEKIQEVIGKAVQFFNGFLDKFRNKKVAIGAEVNEKTTVRTIERNQQESRVPELVDTASAERGVQAANAYKEAFKNAILTGGDIFTALGTVMADQILTGLIDGMFQPLANFMAQVGQNITSSFLQFITQTTVFKQAFTAIMGGLGEVWSKFTSSMVGQFLGGLLQMIGGMVTFVIAAIMNFALVAAGAAASAVAMIPFIGPALAVGAYIGTFALVAAGIGKVIGLANGAAEVVGGSSTDTVPAMLTPGEMVVPKSMAEGIRSGDLALGGTGAATQTSNNVGVNMDGATFNGNISSEMAFGIGEQIALGIKNNLIAPMPS